MYGIGELLMIQQTFTSPNFLRGGGDFVVPVLILKHACTPHSGGGYRPIIFTPKVVHDLFSFRREVLANGPRLRQVRYSDFFLNLL